LIRIKDFTTCLVLVEKTVFSLQIDVFYVTHSTD
jgi:hypothetical protein